jgi:hypothetical protein
MKERTEKGNKEAEKRERLKRELYHSPLCSPSY